MFLLGEINCKVCVRVDNRDSDMFKVNVGSRHWCAVSPWLFNLNVDGVMRKVNAKAMGREVNQLMSAGDTVGTADSNSLQRTVNVFGKIYCTAWTRKSKMKNPKPR